METCDDCGNPMTAMKCVTDAVKSHTMEVAVRDALSRTIERNAENARTSFATVMLHSYLVLPKANAVVYLSASSVVEKKKKMGGTKRSS
jgi:hypothetical protein